MSSQYKIYVIKMIFSHSQIYYLEKGWRIIDFQKKKVFWVEIYLSFRISRYGAIHFENSHLIVFSSEKLPTELP